MTTAGYTQVPPNYDFPRTEGKIFFLTPEGTRIQIASSPTALGLANIISAAGAWTVPGTVVLGDVLAVTGNFTADKADNTTPGRFGAQVIGLVVDLPTATTATVVYGGEASIPGVFTPGSPAFLGTTGAILFTKPTTPGTVAQSLGSANTAGSILVNIGPGLLL